MNDIQKAIIYCRFSPQRDGGDKTTDDQEGICRRWCERQGLRVVAVHRDTERSRCSGYDERPGLWDAVRQAKRGTALVAYRLDRIGSGGMLMVIDRDIQKRGGRILVTEGASNENTPEAQLMRQLMGCIEEYNRLIIGARTSAFMRRQQSDGRRVSGRGKEPYGYTTDPGDESMLAPNPEEQAVVQRILELDAEGYGPSAIASRICKEGFRSRGPSGRFRYELVKGVIERER